MNMPQSTIGTTGCSATPATRGERCPILSWSKQSSSSLHGAASIVIIAQLVRRQQAGSYSQPCCSIAFADACPSQETQQLAGGNCRCTCDLSVMLILFTCKVLNMVPRIHAFRMSRAEALVSKGAMQSAITPESKRANTPVRHLSCSKTSSHLY
jgi:hypothetical protein